MSDEMKNEAESSGSEFGDLKNLWKDLSAEKERSVIAEQVEKRSQHPVQKVRRQLGLKVLYFALAIIVLMVMRFATDNPTSQLLFDVVNASFLVCGIYLYTVWKKLPRHVDVSSNVRKAVTHTYLSTRRALRIEEGLGLFLYPLGAAAGMLWGRELRDPDFIADLNVDWWTLLIVIAVITPLAHFAAVWMNKVAFGKYLKTLRKIVYQFDEL